MPHYVWHPVLEQDLEIRCGCNRRWDESATSPKDEFMQIGFEILMFSLIVFLLPLQILCTDRDRENKNI